MPILSSLSESPKRYVDLESVCKNERTRTDKLRKLEEAKLVATSSKKVGKRTFIHYQLTNKGKAVFEEAEKIEEI